MRENKPLISLYFVNLFKNSYYYPYYLYPTRDHYIGTNKENGFPSKITKSSLLANMFFNDIGYEPDENQAHYKIFMKSIEYGVISPKIDVNEYKKDEDRNFFHPYLDGKELFLGKSDRIIWDHDSHLVCSLFSGECGDKGEERERFPVIFELERVNGQVYRLYVKDRPPKEICSNFDSFMNRLKEFDLGKVLTRTKRPIINKKLLMKEIKKDKVCGDCVKSKKIDIPECYNLTILLRQYSAGVEN